MPVTMNDVQKEIQTHQKIQDHSANAIKRLGALLKKMAAEKENAAAAKAKK